MPLLLAIVAIPAFAAAPGEITVEDEPAGSSTISAASVPAAPGAAPAAPEALVAIGGDSAVTLTWLPSPSPNVIGYNVYRTSEAGKYGTVPVNRSMVTGTEFTDNERNSSVPPRNGVVYFYVVRAVDAAGELSPPSEESRGRPEGAPVITEIPKVGWEGFGESQLSVSGRKVVSMGFTVRTPKFAPGSSQLSGPQSQRLNLEQQLQVRLSGRVGKKINVDVDYDDTAPDQTRQRISVVYAGDPEEKIERAEFGDIRLKLSDTEFTGYDKQLFGIRIQAKPIERLRMTAIATQTQGINATEQFVGNSSKQEIVVTDVSYVLFKYFYIAKPDLVDLNDRGIKPGTEEIWLDDGIGTNNTVNTVRVNGIGRTFDFDVLYQGVDYSIDYTTGVVAFNRSVSQGAAIAVKFEYGDGEKVAFRDALGNSVAISAINPANLVSNWDISTTSWAYTNERANLIFDGRVTGPGDAHMITNWYQLGYRNIVPKEFDPEFTIRILDASGNEISGIIAPQLDSDFYDFGILKLEGAPGRGLGMCDPTNPADDIDKNCPTICGPPVSEQPFAYDPANNFYCVGGNAYMYGSNTGRISRYQIKMRFLTRVLSYRLRNINIVRGSERITMDGRMLSRDVDYFIDYDFGQVTFLRPDQIRYDSRIQIDYEYLPFGGQFQSFLWGARGQYSVSERSTIGATYLSNNAQTPQDAPSATAAPKNTSVAGIDGRTFLSRRELSNFLQVLPGFENSIVPIEMELRGEVARSDINPNNYRQSGLGERGVAMIDSMEGVDDAIEAGVEHSLWFPASVPLKSATDDYSTRSTLLAWHTGEGGHLSSLSRTLDLAYFDMTKEKWDGLRYSLSSIGIDMSNYQYLEMWVYGDGNNSQLAVSLGVLSEDSNGNSLLDTEDVAPADFVLNEGEDTGITRDGSVYWGAYDQGLGFVRKPEWPGPGGNVLNTEDMNSNGTLDTSNRYYEYRFNVNWTGWNHIKIPLSFDSAADALTVSTELNPALEVRLFKTPDAPNKAVIRAMRVWVTAPNAEPSQPVSGLLRIESMRVTGNRWLLRTKPGASLLVDSSLFNVSAINQDDQSWYTPLLSFFRVLEEDAEKYEQSLQIDYSLSEDMDGNYYASRTFPSPVNLLDYRELRLDINKYRVVNDGEILFVRLGGDERNYYQYNIPLDDIGPGWQTVIVNLEDTRNRGTFGSPALSGVKQVSLGVISYNPPAAGGPETIWINNLRLVDPKHKTGVARKVSVRLATPMGTTYIVDPSLEILPAKAGVIADVTYRELDNDFRLIDQPTFLHNDQHQKMLLGTVQVRNIPRLPMTINWQTQERYVEPHHREDPAYFFWPDRTTESYKLTMSSQHFMPVAVDLGADRNVETVKFLTVMAGADYQKVNWSVSPRVRAPLEGWFYVVPLGRGGEATGLARYTKDSLTYGESEIFKNLIDRRTETLDELYDVRTTYEPFFFLSKVSPLAKGFSLSPRAGYSLQRTRGALGSLQVANITNPTVVPSKNRLQPVAQNIEVGLEGRLSGIKGITPSANYTGQKTDNFHLFNMQTKSSLRNNLSLSPGEWVKGVGRPNFNLSYTIETNAQYYDVADPVTRRIEKAYIEQATFRDIWWIDRKNDDITTANAFAETYTVGGRMDFFKLIQVTPNYMFREDTRLAQKLRTRQTNNSVSASVSIMRGQAVESLFSHTPLFWMHFSGFDSQYQYRKTLQFDSKDKPTNIMESHQAQANVPFNPAKNLRGNAGLMGERSVTRIPPRIMNIRQSVRPSLGLGYTTNAGLTVPLIWAKLRMANLITIRHNFQMNFIKDTAEGQQYGNRKKREIQDVTEFEYEMLRGVSLRLRAQFDAVKDYTQPTASFKAYSIFGTFLFNF